jgi:hypothetical protein
MGRVVNFNGPELQPRREQPDDVERFLDLAATEEDHGEVSDPPRVSKLNC